MLASVDRRAQVHVNRPGAAHGRRRHAANLGTTNEVNEYDLIPSRMACQCNTAPHRHTTAGPTRSRKPSEFFACYEIVQGQLITPGDSGDLRCLSERIQA